MLQSKYTTTFNNFCESYWMLNKEDDGETHSRAEKIKFALPAIFSFDYPIWNSNYKPQLEYLIVNHYYLHEIAFETWGQFKMYLESWLNEEMPRFNTLYQAGVSLGDIFTIGYMKTDEYHGTDKYVKNNTGTQKNEEEKTNTGSQTHDFNKDNTGTQNNNRIIKDTGTQVIDDEGSNDVWTSDRDVPEGGDYENNAYVSAGEHEDGVTTNTRTRTDNLNRNDDSTRTDNLNEKSKDVRSDDLQENRENVRTDNLAEEKGGREDNKRTIQMVYDVQDKMNLYNKLWLYYNSVDKEIISAIGTLFLAIW